MMSQFVTLAVSVGIVYLNLFMDVPIQDQTSYSRYRISEQQTRILGPIGLRFHLLVPWCPSAHKQQCPDTLMLMKLFGGPTQHLSMFSHWCISVSSKVRVADWRILINVNMFLVTRLAAFIILWILQPVTFILFSSCKDRHHLDSRTVSHSAYININDPLESQI